MRKRLLLLIISITLGLCGCKLSAYLPRRAEIDRLEFIRIIGIDKGSKDSEDIKITMLYLPHEEESKEQSQGNSGGQAGQQANVSTMVSEGKTISEAIKKAQMESSREIFLGHVFGVIIGDEAAKEDLNKYMDFISRGIEFRLNNNMYIAKGMDAGELIMKSSQSEDFLSDIVEHFSKNYNITSTSGNKKLIELMGELDDKNKGVVIPAIALIEKKGEAPQGEAKDKEGKAVLKLDGYGIIKNGKLIDYADEDVSTGINILNNKYVSGNITITDPYGQEVNLEVIELLSEKTYRFSGDNIESVTLKIIVNSNLDEQHSREDIYTKENLEYLFMEQAEVVKKDVYEAIEFAKDNNVDVLGFGRDIFRKHPIRWEKVEAQWDSIFPNLQVDLDVKSRVVRTYDIIQPNRMKGME